MTSACPYSPRDIIRLMVKLVFEPDGDKLARENFIGIYDPACGTDGILTIGKEYLLAAVNPGLGRRVHANASRTVAAHSIRTTPSGQVERWSNARS